MTDAGKCIDVGLVIQYYEMIQYDTSSCLVLWSISNKPFFRDAKFLVKVQIDEIS